ncbi:MAG: coenzyme F420-0:L-glutamate ligase [Candidatus Bathyarchaeota archaeon]|nr:coenzyme F420-0:L-glutamate ligase [Candidatus Bathyarchaeota archaeon]MDH5495156.1 coenzyme F420-0:L-glutamate ligase [Candidatus Bathyarchaeota archaeon]
MDVIQIIPITGLPIIRKGDKLSKLVCNAAEKQKTPIQNGDIIIITHVIVSRAEGNTINLDTIKPSQFAKTIAKISNKDPALVEVVLREAESIIRMRNGKLITLTRHGFICANSGIDKSNVPGERNVALLPKDPDKSARQLRQEIKKQTGKTVAVIISDTHGRPLRDGEINIAIGVAGLTPIRDRRGKKDLFGYILRVKRTAVADELASAAELVIGQADEGVPIAIIRGYPHLKSEKATVKDMLRSLEKELFL